MKENAAVQAQSAQEAPGAVLQRACACGQHTSGGGECQSCKRKRSDIPRAGVNQHAPEAAPSTALNVLRSPAQSGGLADSPYGQDFSRVRVSKPGEPLEQEAHHAASRIMSPFEPAYSTRKPILAKNSSGQGSFLRQSYAPIAAQPVPAAVAPAIQTPGKPIEPAARVFMENRFGQDFSQVRVHTGPEADQSAHALRANAYTTGQHVVFRDGKYQPSSQAGRRLLAHELAHVVQQSGGGASGFSTSSRFPIQREDDGGQSGGGGSSDSWDTESATEMEIREQPGELEQVNPSQPLAVQRIVISCADMRLRLETTTTAYIYRLTDCSVPIGTYETSVTVTDNDFELDFGSGVSEEERFEFSYYVEPGQENPATLLQNQANVHVDVVERLPVQQRSQRDTATPECAIRLRDRVLVPSDSISRNLFEPIEVERTIWEQSIPLGQFGWVAVSAVVTGDLSGRFSARYGPGRLHDICLTYLVGQDNTHIPLGLMTGVDVTNYEIGGRARFSLPASATIRLVANGQLEISGEYLSVIDVAAARGGLHALGEATLNGRIDGEVEIRAHASQYTPSLSVAGAQISLPSLRSAIDDVDIAAEIGLRGRAGVMARVDLSAGFDLLGYNLWRQSWNLAQFNSGVSWSGGLKYSPNPGLHFDLGTLGAAEEMDLGPDEDEPLSDDNFHEDSAEVEEDEIIDAVLNTNNAQISAPTGLSEDDPLPFTWHKPVDDYIYPKTVDIPNADDPLSLDRDTGPTIVRYTNRGRSIYETIGVADENWPRVHKTFDYLPYADREEPEKNRLRRLLDRLGYDRSGTDVDHVHELQFGGLDQFENLWPADNSANRSAGTRHRNQLENYEQQLGNIAGRWFVITDIEI